MSTTPLVLVLNAGSSSLKVALIEASGARPLNVTRPLEPEPEQWLPTLLQPWRQRIALVGHRVVHGGERFTGPTRLDDDHQAEVLAALEDLVPLAPLHNGPALAVIRLSQRLITRPQWACFDTAFHSTLPEVARTYALPARWRHQGLHRYGFHGLNHAHVAAVVEAQRAGRLPLQEAPMAPTRLLSAHLGAGCSLAAIAGGRCIDTTMGYTPLEGLVMASRSGSVDPGLLLHLLDQGLSAADLNHALNAESGLLGLSGLSGDWRTLNKAAADGHPRAQLALAVFEHRLLQGIGAMTASLGGLDVLALSGGIGANDPALADRLKKHLAWLGTPEILRIPADEEGMIAHQVLEAAARAGLSLDRADPASDAADGSGGDDRH
ncbi:MAG: acetate/propionate family kinase [Cyanobacteriota bacterium]